MFSKQPAVLLDRQTGAARQYGIRERMPLVLREAWGAGAAADFAAWGAAESEGVQAMLRFVTVRAALIGALMSCTASFGGIARVTFESPTLPVGIGYGASSGHSPGQVIPSLGQDGILVSVENFHAGSYMDWFRAEVRGQGADLFSTKHLYLDNVSLGFNLTGVGFPVNKVTIDYREFGGVDNFSVNGGPIIELPALTSLPTNIAPGVTASANSDSITLTGSVLRFLIGGQELAVDNVVAVPEPTCLALLGVGSLALIRRIRRSTGHQQG